jgi:hypothetical protein
MGSTLSELNIKNLALAKVGDYYINSTSEESKAAREVNRVYEPSRDFLLRSFNWSFAITRIELAQLGTDPDFEYDYQYQLPSDYLKMVKLYSTTSNYSIEGQKILTSDDELYLKYVSRVEDPTFFDPIFLEALVLKMAIDLAIPLANNRTLKETLMVEYQAVIRQARMVDAFEDDEDETPEDTDWQNAGRS